MDSDTLVRELEARASELEDEAQRLRSAAEVLQGKPAAAARTQTSGTPGGGRKVAQTNPTILKTLNEHGPMDARTLTTAMLDDGWETSSTTPSNTVRTALGRLVDRGELVRLDGGLYATMRWVEDNAPDE